MSLETFPRTEIIQSSEQVLRSTEEALESFELSKKQMKQRNAGFWNDLFYSKVFLSVEKVGDSLTLCTKELNIFERIFRYLGFYESTRFNKVTDFIKTNNFFSSLEKSEEFCILFERREPEYFYIPNERLDQMETYFSYAPSIMENAFWDPTTEEEFLEGYKSFFEELLLLKDQMSKMPQVGCFQEKYISSKKRLAAIEQQFPQLETSLKKYCSKKAQSEEGVYYEDVTVPNLPVARKKASKTLLQAEDSPFAQRIPDFPFYSSSLGDGNCFYRSFITVYLEIIAKEGRESPRLQELITMVAELHQEEGTEEIGLVLGILRSFKATGYWFEEVGALDNPLENLFRTRSQPNIDMALVRVFRSIAFKKAREEIQKYEIFKENLKRSLSQYSSQQLKEIAVSIRGQNVLNHFNFEEQDQRRLKDLANKLDSVDVQENWIQPFESDILSLFPHLLRIHKENQVEIPHFTALQGLDLSWMESGVSFLALEAVREDGETLEEYFNSTLNEMGDFAQGPQIAIFSKVFKVQVASVIFSEEEQEHLPPPLYANENLPKDKPKETVHVLHFPEKDMQAGHYEAIFHKEQINQAHIDKIS